MVAEDELGSGSMIEISPSGNPTAEALLHVTLEYLLLMKDGKAPSVIAALVKDFVAIFNSSWVEKFKFCLGFSTLKESLGCISESFSTEKICGDGTDGKIALRPLKDAETQALQFLAESCFIVKT